MADDMASAVAVASTAANGADTTMHFDSLKPLTSNRASVCIGCNREIYDRYILRVAPDLEWHAACLRCAHCQRFLDENCTTFVKNGKTYCKEDYVRLFTARCAFCGEVFARHDSVMRARQRMYHVNCFRCQYCSRPLVPGEEFALIHDRIYCRQHHEALMSMSLGPPSSNTIPMSSQPTIEPKPDDDPTLALRGSVDVTPPLTNAPNRPTYHKKDKKDKGKGTRVRTVLNEKQLHTLRTCYQANPRPDALMKEQLVEMTGLSPRVIRVWFQNKRCKDKKRQVMMKHIQQQHEKASAIHGVRVNGIGPLIAGETQRQEGNPLGVIQAHEIQALQQQMRPNGQGALWTPLQPHTIIGDNDTDAAPFQQLMQGFGDDNAIECRMGAYSSADSHNMNPDTDMDSFSPSAINHSDELSSNASND